MGIIILIFAIICLCESSGTYSRSFGTAEDTRAWSARAIVPTGSSEDKFMISGKAEKVESVDTIECIIALGEEYQLGWVKSLTSKSPLYGGFLDMVRTSDDQYVTVGSIFGYGVLEGEVNPLIVKVTDDGDIIFGRVIDIDPTNIDSECEAMSVYIANNGDFLVCGGCNDRSEGFLLRMSQTPPYEITMLNKYTGTSAAQLVDVIQNPNGEMFVLGDTKSSYIDGNILIMKLRSNGSIIWAKQIVAFHGEGMIVHGGSIFIHGNDLTRKPLLIEIDGTTGSVIWSKMMAGSSNLENRIGTIRKVQLNTADSMIGVGEYSFLLESKNAYYTYILVFRFSLVTKQLEWTVFPNFMSSSDESDYLYGRNDGDYGYSISTIGGNEDRMVVCGTVEIGNGYKFRRGFYGIVDSDYDDKICTGIHATIAKETMYLSTRELSSLNIEVSDISVTNVTHNVVDIPITDFTNNIKDDMSIEMLCSAMYLWVIILAIIISTIIFCCCCMIIVAVACLLLCTPVVSFVFFGFSILSSAGGMGGYFVNSALRHDDDDDDENASGSTSEEDLEENLDDEEEEVYNNTTSDSPRRRNRRRRRKDNNSNINTGEEDFMNHQDFVDFAGNNAVSIGEDGVTVNGVVSPEDVINPVEVDGEEFGVKYYQQSPVGYSTDEIQSTQMTGSTKTSNYITPKMNNFMSPVVVAMDHPEMTLEQHSVKMEDIGGDRSEDDKVDSEEEGEEESESSSSDSSSD